MRQFTGMASGYDMPYISADALRYGALSMTAVTVNVSVSR